MRVAISRRHAGALACAGTLALSACASAPRMQAVGDLDPGAALAFGTAQVVVDGEVQKFGSFWARNEFYLLVLPEDSDEAITAPVTEDGRFYWPLEPGRYTLLGWAWVEGGNRRTGPISGTFTVPSTGEDVYVGDMVIAGSKQDLEFGLREGFDDARAAYEGRFPARMGRAVSGVLEPLEPVGDYARILAPCADHWQVDCSEGVWGVTPTGPASSTSGFPEVTTTRPEFRWLGCGLSGVTYDVAVYRAAAYNVGGMKDQVTRGHLAAYVEDLGTPYWIPETPLDPGTRYFWSVRMRDGDAVSAWSTQTRSTFLLVYASWSHGNWFEFRTPPAGG